MALEVIGHRWALRPADEIGGSGDLSGDLGFGSDPPGRFYASCICICWQDFRGTDFRGTAALAGATADLREPNRGGPRVRSFMTLPPVLMGRRLLAAICRDHLADAVSQTAVYSTFWPRRVPCSLTERATGLETTACRSEGRGP